MTKISVNTDPKVLKHGGRYTTDGSYDVLIEAIYETVNKYASKSGITFTYEDVENLDDEDGVYDTGILSELLELRYEDPTIRKDLSKIRHISTDNYGIDGDHFADCTENLGFMTTKSGITYYACWACGDESLTPYVLIFYFDGKKLRAYIPIYGNAWDTLNKCEIDYDSDDFLIRETGYNYDDLEDHDMEIYTNLSMVKQDIEARLELKES